MEYFNGGQNRNAYKSKISDAKSEEYAYKNLKNVLTTNISKAYLNLKLNEEKIISSLKEIESSVESVRLSRLRYDVGISTLKDVLVRQSELSNAKSVIINARYNYNLNLDELERLTFLEISKNCLNTNNRLKDTETICNIKMSLPNLTNTPSELDSLFELVSQLQIKTLQILVLAIKQTDHY